LAGQGRYTDAEAIYREILAIDTRISGPESADALRAMSNLAIALDLERRYNESESLFDRVIALRTRTLGPKHPKTLASMDAKAEMLEHASRFAEAEQAFNEVVALRGTVLGPRHQHTRYSMVSLAEVLLAEKKFPQAEAVLKTLSAQTPPGEETWLRALRQSLLGESLAGQKRYAEAAPLLKSGYAELRQAQIPLLYRPERRFEVRRARQRLVAFYREQRLRIPADLKTF
jgi:tetratricopeptide (TPR) repeat protein